MRRGAGVSQSLSTKMAAILPSPHIWPAMAMDVRTYICGPVHQGMALNGLRKGRV